MDVDWSENAVGSYWLREAFTHGGILPSPVSEALPYNLTQPALAGFEASIRQDLADRVRTRPLRKGSRPMA